MILNPLLAREWAMPSPIPLSEPVTIATLFSLRYWFGTFLRLDSCLGLRVYPWS